MEEEEEEYRWVGGWVGRRRYLGAEVGWTEANRTKLTSTFGVKSKEGFGWGHGEEDVHHIEDGVDELLDPGATLADVCLSGWVGGWVEEEKVV